MEKVKKPWNFVLDDSPKTPEEQYEALREWVADIEREEKEREQAKREKTAKEAAKK